MSSYQTDFIANLKYYRGEKGLSQAKLAELCDCGTGTIGSIEAARQYPSFDLLFKIANVLEVHPADLFLRDASNKNNNMREHIEHILASSLHTMLEKEFSQNKTNAIC
jgi:transcriptional regulator with XRE-family HTH domain